MPAVKKPIAWAPGQHLHNSDCSREFVVVQVSKDLLFLLRLPDATGAESPTSSASSTRVRHPTRSSWSFFKSSRPNIELWDLLHLKSTACKPKELA